MGDLRFKAREFRYATRRSSFSKDVLRWNPFFVGTINPELTFHLRSHTYLNSAAYGEFTVCLESEYHICPKMLGSWGVGRGLYSFWAA